MLCPPNVQHTLQDIYFRIRVVLVRCNQLYVLMNFYALSKKYVTCCKQCPCDMITYKYITKPFIEITTLNFTTLNLIHLLLHFMAISLPNKDVLPHKWARWPFLPILPFDVVLLSYLLIAVFVINKLCSTNYELLSTISMFCIMTSLI